MSASTAGPLPAASLPAPSRPAAIRVAPGVIALVGVVILTLSAVLLLSGNPLLAAAPLLLLLVVVLFAALPLRVPLFGLVFLAALVDSQPIELPASVTGISDDAMRAAAADPKLLEIIMSYSAWKPPLFPVYTLLFDNLNKVLPIEALRFSLVDLFYVLAIVLLAVRGLFRIRTDTAGRQPATTALYLVAGLSLLGAVWLEVWGVGLRGGDFRQSLWQMRQLFWLPTVTVLFVCAMRDFRDFNRAINLITAAVCLKLVIVVWYYFAVARPMHFEPATLTSHYDSILFTVAIVAWVSRFVHTGNWKYAILLATLGNWVMLGIVLNNRRLCFVNLAVSLFIVFVMLKGPMKRMLMKKFVYVLPLLVAYVVVGQAGNSRIFKPAKLVTSVIKQDDRSSSTRDVENYNLLVTLKRNKLLGSGWGHEYVEAVKGDDISTAFPQYRYMAHNGVLWLWTIGGLVGFTLLWMPISIGIFLARRAYSFARSPDERSAAAIALTMIVTYMLQAWGDIGTQHLNSTLVLALALAASAKLAVANGAMPRRMRLFSFRRAEAPVSASVSWVGGVQ